MNILIPVVTLSKVGSLSITSIVKLPHVQCRRLWGKASGRVKNNEQFADRKPFLTLVANLVGHLEKRSVG